MVPVHTIPGSGAAIDMKHMGGEDRSNYLSGMRNCHMAWAHFSQVLECGSQEGISLCLEFSGKYVINCC